MKKIIMLVVLTVFAAILMVGCGSASQPDNALAIGDIQADPLSFTGELTLNGVNVGSYPDDNRIFFLMDTAEVIACKNIQCGAIELPVIYKGTAPLPQVADEVNVTGSWGTYELQTPNGTEIVDVFEITQIDVKRNIMSLLQ